LVERHARLAAAEDAYIAVAADLDRDRRLVRVSGPVPLGGRFAVRASIAYKGAWVRRTRTFARDAAGRAAAARGAAWLDQVVRSIVADKPLAAQITAQAEKLPAAPLRSFMAESSIGTYPLEVVDSSRSLAKDAPAPGTYLVLTVELAIDGVPWIGAAPAFVGG
jgi:hypothetical protein